MKLIYLKNSIKFQELYNVFYIILTEVMRKTFSSSFFSSKKKIVLFCCSVAIGYISYVLYNLIELKNLTHNILMDEDIVVISVISSLNTIMIFSMFVFILVENTFKFSPSTVFILKKYPFHNKSINIIKYLYKLFISFVLYLFISNIIMFISKTILSGRLLFFSFMIAIGYLMFFIVFNFCFSFNLFISNIVNNKNIFIKKIGLFTITVFGFFYFFIFRFKIDQFLSSKILIQNIILKETNLGLSFIFFILLFLISIWSVLKTCKKYYIEEEALSYISLFKNAHIKNFNMLFKTVKSLVREKTILGCFLISISLTLSALIATVDIKQTLIMALYSMMTFLSLSLHYYNTTINERKLYNLFQFEPLKEFLLLCSSFVLIFSPYVLMLMINFKGYIEVFFLMFFVFLTFILFGILFPKGKNSINEIVSFILSGLLVILCFLLYQSFDILILISSIVLLSTVTIMILHKDRMRSE